MKLHEAIELVLKENKRPMSTQELADIINARKLYVRGDGLPLPKQQIYLRSRNYVKYFQLDGQMVSLNNEDAVSIERYHEDLKKYFSIHHGRDKGSLIILCWFYFLRKYPTPISELPIKKTSFLKEVTAVFTTDFSHSAIAYITGTFSSFSNTDIEFLVGSARSIQPLIYHLNKNEFKRFITTELDQSATFDRYNNKVASVLLYAGVVNSNSEKLKILDPNLFGFNIHESLFSAKLEGKVESVTYISDYNPELVTAAILCNAIEVNVTTKFTSESKLTSIQKEDYNTIITQAPIGRVAGTPQLFTADPMEYPVPTNKLELLYVQYIQTLLKPGVKAAIVLPRAFFNSRDRAAVVIRKQMLEQGLVNRVIEVPTGSFFSPSVDSGILVLSLPENTKKNTFHLVKLKEVNSTENLTELNKQYHEADKEISISSIREYDYIMTEIPVIEQYRNQLDGKVVKLSDLVEWVSYGVPVSSEYLNEENGIPYISPADLRIQADEVFDVNKVNRFISDDNDMTPNYFNIFKNIIQTKVLLINRVGTNSFPTIVKSDKLFFYNPNIFAVKLKTTSTTLEYIAEQLRTEFVQEQINVFSAGSVIRNIKHQDFQNLMIVLPADRSTLNEPNLEYNANSSVKPGTEIIIGITGHEIKNIAQGFNSLIDGLEYFMNGKMSSGEPIKADEKVSKSKTVSIIELICLLRAQTEDLISVTTDMKDYFNIYSSEFEKELVNTEEFFLSMFNEFDDVNWFTIKNLAAKDFYINPKMFRIALRNLIRNSLIHGFADKPIENGAMQFTIENDADGNIVIQFTNTGEQFPDNFDFKNYISLGKAGKNSKGTGLGGYITQQVISMHDGAFELVDKKPVHFKITLPGIES
jgi:hypothetical protein